MRIGSHNTMTYLPVKRWWMRPLHFAARCQRLSLVQQFMLGVRFFDFRLMFRPDGKGGFTPSFAHGLIEFEGDPMAFANTLTHLTADLSDGKPVYVRVLNERDDNHDAFRECCQRLENALPFIRWCGGRNKRDWRVLYRFSNAEPDYTDKYASNNRDVPFLKKCTGWLFDDLWPWIYAVTHNRHWRRHFTELDKANGSDTLLLLDFVDIK